jgi:hypothetical protein
MKRILKQHSVKMFLVEAENHWSILRENMKGIYDSVQGEKCECVDSS